MNFFIALRFVGIMWVVGGFLFYLNTISYLLFSEDAWAAKWRNLWRSLGFCIIWPIGIFSPAGRSVLLGYFHKL